MNYERELVKDVASFEHDPLGYVNYIYRWDTKETEVEGNTLRSWQYEFFSDLSNHLEDPKTRHAPFLYAVSSGHGIGKAQRYDSIIPTPNGDKRLDQICIGDYVFSKEGTPTMVLAVKKWENRPCFRVTFDDKTSVVVDENHLWPVYGRQERRKKQKDYRVLSTKEILNLGVKRPNGKSCTRQWHLPSIEPIYGKIKERYSYAIGVWIGDGSSNKGCYTKPDQEIRDKLRMLGHNIKLSGCDENTVVISGLVKKLKEYNILKLRSYERHLPDNYLLWDIDSRLQLLSGLLDTDGECGRNGSIVYSTTSEKLLNDIVMLCRSLGYKAYKQKPKKAYLNGVRHRDCYRLTVNIPQSKNPFSIKRKAERVFDSSKRYERRWIDSIERVSNADTICISVESKDGLYLANDYILTHNSSLIGMLLNWGLSTCTDTRAVVTSNTDTQLRTKTMPEIGKWFKLALNSHWFKITATSIFSTDKKHEKSWRADATPWSKNNTEAFAGLHNKKKRIILVFDEGSAIDDKVWEVAEGALTDEDTEIIWVAFGNPTRNTGRFRECFRKFKHRWKNKQIDSRDVEGTNKTQLETWVNDYGENSDFVKVRVRGIFPTQSFKQFISTEDADNAFNRELNEKSYDFAPKILTLDPAWEGDDEAVFGFRQGLYSKILDVVEKNDNDMEMANHLMRLEDEHNADAVFIDAGYGTGIYSIGKTMKRNWQLVWFGGKASDKGCLNKRAEMWRDFRDWLKEGGSIPNDTKLLDEITGPETVPRLDGKIQIESKKDMKARGIPSPNRADAIILSFAYPVKKKANTKPKTSKISYSNGSGWMG